METKHKSPIKKLFIIINLIVSIILAISIYYSWNDEFEDYRSDLKYINLLLNNSTTTFLNNHETILRILGKDLIDIAALEAPENGRDMIESAARLDKEMAGFGLADTTGQLKLISTVRSKNLPSLADRPGFSKTLEKDHIVTGIPYYMAQLDRWVIPIRVAIRDNLGTPLGVMSAGYKITGGSTTWSDITLPEGFDIKILREDGFLQFTSKNDSFTNLYSKNFLAPIAKKIKNTDQDNFFLEANIHNKKHLLFVSKLPKYELYNIATVPMSIVREAQASRVAGYILILLASLFISRFAITYMKNAQKEYEDELIFKATHDPLTNLPNRVVLTEEIEEQIERCENEEYSFAFMFLDIDNFKYINDTHGHIIGDKYIEHVAEILQKIVGEYNLVARQGGDEFMILLKDIHHSDEIRTMADNILRAFTNAMIVDSHNVLTTVSIGISVAPKDTLNSLDLFKHANTALFSIKEQGKNNYAFYSQELSQEFKRKAEIEKLLKREELLDELSVHYQIQVDSLTEKVSGVEALVRWENSPIGGIYPDEFIPIAENLGISKNIDTFVLEKACKDIKENFHNNGNDIELSINVSAMQLMEPHLKEQVQEILERTGFNNRLLNLEITETAILNDFDTASQRVKRLKELNISISLDDFGTGYSSLNYLHKLMIDEIKIDKSFIFNMFSDEYTSKLVSGIVSLGKNLGLKVVAEGVETKEHAEKLEEFNCDTLQGYYYSKPVDLNKLKELIN